MPPPIIRLKIDVTAIIKEAMFTAKKPNKNGKTPVYLEVSLWDKPHEFPDGKTTAGYITQEIPKELRDGGMKGEILGNWSYIEKRETVNLTPPKNRPPANPRQTDPNLDVAGDDCPF